MAHDRKVCGAKITALLPMARLKQLQSSATLPAARMRRLPGQGPFGLERGGWLFVLLVLLTLLPSGGVVWFMNAPGTSESAAGQQRVMEAYRRPLRLVRGRMDPVWPGG